MKRIALPIRGNTTNMTNKIVRKDDKIYMLLPFTFENFL